MFEHKVAEKAEFDEQLVEFIRTYERFTHDALRVAELIDQNRANAQDRLRMHRFEARVDEMWQEISEEKRDILVSALLAKKLLPEELETVLRIFKGGVIEI